MAQQPFDPNQAPMPPVNGGLDAAVLPANPGGVGVPPPQQIDPEALKRLGKKLYSRFEQYERDRRIAEIKWMRNIRQYLGVHDPEVEAKMDPNRSKVYPRITRVKCVSTISRLMNLLFNGTDKNYSVEPSPVPNLSPEDLDQVMQKLYEVTQGDMDDELIEEAIEKFAWERAINLEAEIEDQLDELGGDRTISHTSLSKQVIKSGVIYGMGVLKGPMVRTQEQRTWQKDAMTGQYAPTTITAMRPQFEFVSLWDYYPDMTAKVFSQMDGQFQRHVFSRHQLRKLADREDFMGEAIKEYLNRNQSGNYKRRTYETELKSMGVALNTGDTEGRKYEAIQWFGYVYGQDLLNAGVDVPEDMMHEDVEADIWMIDNEIIKADINPWVELDTGYKVNMYHQFVFEEDETSITGNALPNIMRDSQMAIVAASMMMMDNASVVCGPNIELNTDLLRLDQDLKSVTPHKIWYREGLGADAAMPAVREIQINSHIPELLQIIDKFMSFADQETFVNAANGGDMSKGPSEPFRTATGASMLKGDAALPFKDVVRNFDLFTESVITSLVAFNQQLNPKESIRGDFQVQAKGSTSLIAKEIRGIQLDSYVQTLQPDEKAYVDMYELAKERAAVRDLPSTIIVGDKEAKKIQQSQSEKAQKAEAQNDETIRAEIRKTLADALKGVSQANKNQAAANEGISNSANNVLGGMESDIGGEGQPEDPNAGIPAGPVPEQGGAGPTGGGGAGFPPVGGPQG